MFWKQNELTKNEKLIINQLVKELNATWYKGLNGHDIETEEGNLSIKEGISRLFSEIDITKNYSVLNYKICAIAAKYDIISPYPNIVIAVGNHPFTALDGTIIKTENKIGMQYFDKNGNIIDNDEKAVGVIFDTVELAKEQLHEAELEETLLKLKLVPEFNQVYEKLGLLESSTPLISLTDNKYIDEINRTYGEKEKSDLAEVMKGFLDSYNEVLNVSNDINDKLDKDIEEHNKMMERFNEKY